MRIQVLIFFLLAFYQAHAQSPLAAQASSSANNLNLAAKETVAADTTRLQKVKTKLNNHKSRTDSVINSKDSLHAVQQVRLQKEKADSIRQQVQAKADSVAHALDPSALMDKGMAQLKDKSDSIFNGLLGAKKDTLQQKFNNVKSSVTGATQKVGSSIAKVTSPFQEQGAAVPNINLPETGAVNMTSLPSANGLNADLPQGTLPTDLPKADIPNIELDKTNEVKAGISEKITNEKESIKELGQFEELNELQEKTEVIRDVSSKVESVKKEGAGKVAEEAIANTDQVKALSKELSAADKAKQYYDPQVAKEEMLNKAKLEAVNHFAGHESELVAVMEKLSAAKAKIPDPEGVIDLFAKRQNTQRGKKWHERLTYGVSLQFQKPSALWLDVNPYVLYKFSDKIAAGAGWTTRWSYHIKERDWRPKEKIYGPRASFEWKAKKDFAFKADIECVNGVYPARIINGQLREYENRVLIWSYFAGVKKSFKFSEKVKGNVQMMYNVYNPEKHSPYADRINVRIGFEWSKKSKPGLKQ
ncbi:hypothetical protein SanaruYs_06550 [Chryseotalea sanaruensis]|uniref:DUF3575 domain-containing protein n=1 Tax=Chryseotalea sanaruensis TaxID=2482724 RepID=A0A401U6H0_9BACT|nr:hypothetical protein [Chryseotalea sanaruensis]GCC50440.1 hypothetical protein SanaruYs_06550 [Chryseotalea sanaruensis]